MTNVLVSVPDQNTEAWLDAVAEFEALRDVEVSAVLFQEESRANLLKLASRNGLHPRMVRNLIPGEVGRNLEALPDTEIDRLAEKLREDLSDYGEEGAYSVVLDLGLEKIDEKDEDGALRRRVTFVRRFLPTIESRDLQLLIPVRYPPPHPGACTWETATNLVHEVMHPACRLLVNFYPGEAEDDFDRTAFVRRCALHLGAIRFIYEPMLGETPNVDTLEAWRETLMWHGFRGALIFAPRISDVDAVRPACSKISEYASTLLRA